MQTIQLAPHMPAFSRLVYGAWRLNENGNANAAQIVEKIEHCLVEGITTFDHADIYGDYSCETLFGQALQRAPALRQRIQIVTKCGIALLSDRHPQRRIKHYDTGPTYIRASVDNSLQRLGVDHLDLLLIHRPDPFMDAAATGACLDALVASGKVRGVGASNFLPSDWNLLQSAMATPLLTNQVELSLLRRDAFTDGTLAQSQTLRAPPMAWSPLAGGALAGQSEAALRLAPTLQRIGEAHGVGPDAVALAWLLAHPARIIPVVGTSQLRRIQRLADCFKVPMDRETWFELWTLAAGCEVA